MNKYMLKLGTAISSAALVASSFVVPAAALTVDLSGNGSDSNNTVNVNSTSNTSVNQTNNADINNDVKIDGDSGGNDVEDNTGGDSSVDTGDVNATVNIVNEANGNNASVEGCCPAGDVDIKVSGNGADSDNDVTVNSTNDVDVDQNNDAYIYNDVDVDGDSGDNDVKDNTGGDSSVETGNVDASVTIANAVNWNGAVVNGSNGNGGVLSIEISGNGADSDSNVGYKTNSSVNLYQNNDADVDNDVDVDGDSGDNDVKDNTGGDSSVDTGDVNADVEISNLANFNFADLDACGCPLDEESSITVKDNGADSDNDVTLSLLSDLYADQNNDFDCGGYHEEWKACNDVDVDGDSGDNDVKDNTVGEDPEVTTGDVDADVNIENSANSNVLNDPDFEFPDFGDLGDSASSVFAILLAIVLGS